MKAAARFLMIVALMVSIGAHWGVLQVAAWANMVTVYSAEKGLWEGLKDTFDGEHPCSMCERISTERSNEQQKAPVSKVESSNLSKWLGVAETNVIPQPAWNETRMMIIGGAGIMHLSLWDVSPAVPPPRFAA